MKKILLIIATLITLSISAHAVTWITDGSVSDVQAKHDLLATNGDKIRLPAGTFAWPTNANISKDVIVFGAGIDQTIIEPAGTAFYINNSFNQRPRISGMTFRGGLTSATVIHASSEYNTTGHSYGLRLDHLRFDYDSIGTAIYITGINWGVADHCVFDVRGGNFYIFNIKSLVDGEWPNTMGDTAWAYRPTKLGTAQAFYIEDCVFNHNTATNNGNTSVLDATNGSRVVFRYNSIYGSMVQLHWCGTNERGALKTEIYENTFNGTYGTQQFVWPVAFRSGTGVIFNNTVTNYQTNNFYVFDYRTCVNYTGRFTRCDGSNQYDGNTTGEWGWPCRDQIGRGSGQAVTAAQPSLPLYAWNNGAASVVVSADFDQCLVSPPHEADHIKTTQHTNGEVDYVDGTPMPGYTPYVYPHPLNR